MLRPKRYYRTMTPEKAAQIRNDYAKRIKTQAELAKEHGIQQGSVSRIVSGMVWA